jgi:hypothetical protein
MKRYVVLVALLLAGEVFAYVGNPLTPMSYAGVARRTARRTTRRNIAAGNAAYATLPPGCPPTGGACGGATYAPYYDGPNVVYIQQ